MIEKTGLDLLKNGCSVLLGLPAYGVACCVFRKGNPVTPEEIIGTKEGPFSTSILQDYQQMRGYHFPWGTLSEEFTEGEDEEADVPYVDFSFAPREVYLAFPDGWHLADLFYQLYQSHPLRHGNFNADPENIIFDWTVIAFQARGEREIKALRSWLVKVFIPLIWPDLLREATKLIEQKKASVVSQDGSFEELLSDRSRGLLSGNRA